MTSPLDPIRERPLPSAAKTFLNLLRRKGYSSHTIAAYGSDLERYFRYLGERKAGFKGVRRVDIEDFSMSLDAAKLGNRSITRTLSAVKSFYKWLNDTEEHVNAVRDWMDLPKFRKKLAIPLTQDEAAALLKAVRKNPEKKIPEIWMQDMLMIRLLYATGMRLGDIVKIRPQDLDLPRNEILTTSKGNKDRWVDIDDGTRFLLTRFLATYPRAAADPLFKNVRKTAFSEVALRRYLQFILKRYGKHAGITKRVYPHLLRHSCAVHMLENDADLKAIQDQLGHADISTTQIYLQMSNQHRKRQYRASHPLAK